MVALLPPSHVWRSTVAVSFATSRIEAKPLFKSEGASRVIVEEIKKEGRVGPGGERREREWDAATSMGPRPKPSTAINLWKGQLLPENVDIS